MPRSNYAVRLRLPYESLRQVISDWALRSNQVVVYEHPEEGNVHCHALLVGVYDTTNTLRNDLKKHNVPLKGAGQLSFKTAEDEYQRYITYMSKGKYDPKYNKGFSDEEFLNLKTAWVEHAKGKPKEWDLYKRLVSNLSEEEKYNLNSVKMTAILICEQEYGRWSRKMRNDVSDLIDTYCWNNRGNGLKQLKDYKLPFQ